MTLFVTSGIVTAAAGILLQRHLHSTTMQPEVIVTLNSKIMFAVCFVTAFTLGIKEYGVIQAAVVTLLLVVFSTLLFCVLSFVKDVIQHMWDNTDE